MTKKSASQASSLPGNWRRVFAIPLVLSCASLAGLLAALLGDESWRYVAWPAIALPLIVAGYCAARARSFFFPQRR